LKKHLENCINRIAIENFQYEENYIPTEMCYDYNKDNKENHNEYIRKESTFKEEDIG